MLFEIVEKEAAQAWSTVVQQIPSPLLKFALNVSQETLTMLILHVGVNICKTAASYVVRGRLFTMYLITAQLPCNTTTTMNNVTSSFLLRKYWEVSIVWWLT